MSKKNTLPQPPIKSKAVAPTASLGSLGSIIKDLREERDITQEQFAQKLNTSQSAVARIESGTQNLTAQMIQKISVALKRDLVKVNANQLNLKIKGGGKLRGIVETKTSKNAAVAMLAASLLNRGTTTLHRVPQIEEVKRLVEVLESIGVDVKKQNKTLIITPPKKFDLKKLDADAAKKTRSIIMFAGSLMSRIDTVSMPTAGGCRLGSRSISAHIRAFEKLSVVVSQTGSTLNFNGKNRRAAEVVMFESGDTATENAIMAAATTAGQTTIKYASANYMVQDLCYFLKSLGIQIDGIGSTTLTIHGTTDPIDTAVEYTLMEDPIDSMFFIAAALVTDSNLTITRCPLDFLELEVEKLTAMGAKINISKSYVGENGHTRLGDITIKSSTLTALSDKIESRPYPGLNIDNLPFFAVIATAAAGTTFIHDWVYENRAIYYKELDKLGAQTLLADPHRMYVTGRTKLQPAEVICPPALRPAAIILIAMLAAEGTSVLRNIYSINRGYEDIVNRLNDLGANVCLLNEL